MLLKILCLKAPGSIMIVPIKVYFEILLSFNIEKDVKVLNSGYDAGIVGKIS